MRLLSKLVGKIIGVIALIVCVSLAYQFFLKSQPSNTNTNTKQELPSELVNLNNVIDGDTLSVTAQNGKVYTVRLIGVDTPECKHPDANRNTKYGTMASDYTKSLLKDQTTIELYYDQERTDRYGRLLAYVYYTKEYKQHFLNEELIKNGYAKDAAFKPNILYALKFKTLCTEAIDQKTGLWQYEDFEFYK